MQTPSLILHSAPPPPGEVCAACGRVIGELEQPFIWEESIVCFGCHRDLSEAQCPPSALSDPAHERVFFSDSRVHISRSQVGVDGIACPVADIRFVRLTKTTPKRALGFAACVIGVITSVFGLNRNLDRLDLVVLILGASLFGIGLATALVRRTRYSVLIDVTGGEICLLSTTKAKYAGAIVNAVGEAVVERGQYIAEAPPPQLGLPPTMRAELDSETTSLSANLSAPKRRN